MSGNREPSGAAIGWTIFAATMLLIVGSFWIIAGLAGIIGDNTIFISANYIVNVDTTTWGWVHLLVGIIVLLAGFGLFNGQVWARTVGVIVAIGNMIVAFAWLPHYPIWAVCIMAVDITVIWALTAHGKDITQV